MKRQSKISFLNKDLYWTNPDIIEQENIIIPNVMKEWNVRHRKDLLSKKRKAELVIPRHACSYLLYTRTGQSKQEVAITMGYATYRSVEWAVKQTENMISTNFAFRDKLRHVQRVILEEELLAGIQPRQCGECFFVLSSLYGNVDTLSDRNLKTLMVTLRTMNAVNPERDISKEKIYPQIIKRIMQ